MSQQQSNALQQIVTSYETLGLTVEQIANLDGLEPAAVKAILYSNSALYREANTPTSKDGDATEAGPDAFNSTDEQLALGVIRRVAQTSDDDNAALRAAMFIRNDKRGRLDVKAGLRDLRLNVSVINAHFAAVAQSLLDKTMPSAQPKQLAGGGGNGNEFAITDI